MKCCSSSAVVVHELELDETSSFAKDVLCKGNGTQRIVIMTCAVGIN